MPDDFDVLAGGVEHLEHALVRHQLEERLEVDALGERVDHDRLVGARELRHAQQREIRGLAQEFGVNGDERMAGKARAGGSEVLGRRDQLHAGFIPDLGACRHGARSIFRRIGYRFAVDNATPQIHQTPRTAGI